MNYQWLLRPFKRVYYRLFIQGRPGFTQLMYKGKPIISKDYVPTGEVWRVRDSQINGGINIIGKRKMTKKEIKKANDTFQKELLK